MKIARRPKTDENMELSDYIATMKRAKADMATAEAVFSHAQDMVIKLMEQQGAKSETLSVNGELTKVTVVAQERVKFDEPGLLKALGTRSFNALTRRKLDAGLVKAAVTEGKVDATVIAQHSTIVTSAPYVRISLPDAENE